MRQEEQRRLTEALERFCMYCERKGLQKMLERARELYGQARLGLEPEGLEQISNLMKAAVGYDPQEGDTSQKREKLSASQESEAREVPSLQDLRRRIYVTAKAEPSKRFWGLYVHVCKMDTLTEAYRHAKENNGAAGIDGVTFEEIEADGVDQFLEQIRDELVTRTYRPMRARKTAIPKDGGKKTRVLSIPAIRDRVVQGALKLILEAIFEADFQPGSYAFRPKRSQRPALARVKRAIFQGKTLVIDLDLKAYFDTVRHHILLEKVAKRVKDDEIMRLLKLVLRATGKKGVPQGGVISPLLSNVYLNEVDRMLERAIETTREGNHTHVEYARFADDLVVLVDGHPKHAGLVETIQTRLREEFAKLQVEVNEEKSRTVDLRKGESFSFLGFDIRRLRSLKGKWWPKCTPRLQKRRELTRKLKGIFRRYRSRPTARLIEEINPILRGWVNYFAMGNSSRCFSYVRDWVMKKVRRNLMRARGRTGFGWKRWSNGWIYRTLGLFGGYRVRWTA